MSSADWACPSAIAVARAGPWFTPVLAYLSLALQPHRRGLECRGPGARIDSGADQDIGLGIIGQHRAAGEVVGLERDPRHPSVSRDQGGAVALGEAMGGD